MKNKILAILVVLIAVDWVTAYDTYGNMFVRHILRWVLKVL